MQAAQIRALVEAAFDGASVEVVSDDNTHFAARIIAKEFAGMRPIARHQLVYRSLGSRVGNEIHALSIQAFTPEEWSARDPG